MSEGELMHQLERELYPDLAAIEAEQMLPVPERVEGEWVDLAVIS